MGLKCSVLGHAYGETTVERDREEQGSEVVITIREVETCERCGSERVVSENKEVTAIETPDDDLGAADEQATETADAERTDDSPTDDEDDAADDGATASENDDESEPETGAPTEADEDADDDDATVETGEELSASEIVGDDETPPEPSGEEPDAGAEIIDAESEEPVDDAVDEELADPTVDPDIDDPAEDEPEPDADDAVIIDEDDEDGPVETGDRQPGEWPEEPDDGDEEWQPDTIGSIEDRDEAGQPTETTTLTVPDGQFRCPECDFTTLVESSSLRRGDFCPECHRGTLVHEPEDETRKE